MDTTPKVLWPVTTIRFRREHECEYHVIRKQGEDIPGFLGTSPYKPFIGITEYIHLEREFKDDGEDLEWSFHTSNKDAIAAESEKHPDRNVLQVLLTCFSMTSKNKAYGTYNDFALLIEFSEDWRFLDIHFFEDEASWASCIFTCWENGLLDELSISTW
ncbi:MAG: hypothetical protein LBI03_00635 [Clostridiales bacterium]|jgi:hypothetical protein|nr:hypothetical protein [Clostridiales bacterium]